MIFPSSAGVGSHREPRCGRCVGGSRVGSSDGRFSSTFVGGGAVCAKPWKDGANNGGATSPGVTKDTITVVAVVPNDVQNNSPGGTAPVNRNGNTPGNYQDAVHDYLLPLMKYYETWGRGINVKILVSSGNDETAQRADVVAAKADTPFAVVNFVPAGLDVFDDEMARRRRSCSVTRPPRRRPSRRPRTGGGSPIHRRLPSTPPSLVGRSRRRRQVGVDRESVGRRRRNVFPEE